MLFQHCGENQSTRTHSSVRCIGVSICVLQYAGMIKSCKFVGKSLGIPVAHQSPPHKEKGPSGDGDKLLTNNKLKVMSALPDTVTPWGLSPTCWLVLGRVSSSQRGCESHWVSASVWVRVCVCVCACVRACVCVCFVFIADNRRLTGPGRTACIDFVCWAGDSPARARVDTNAQR